MAYDPVAIDATLAAAAGDEPALIAELRQAFLDSALKGLEAMAAAGDTGTWQAAALRLKGLAASFGAVRLMRLADMAVTQGRDPTILDKLQRMVGRL